jgi:hypothetical protein
LVKGTGQVLAPDKFFLAHALLIFSENEHSPKNCKQKIKIFLKFLGSDSYLLPAYLEILRKELCEGRFGERTRPRVLAMAPSPSRTFLAPRTRSACSRRSG